MENRPMSSLQVLEHLFTPLQIGRMQLRNRIMLPPHGRVTGNPFGTEEECERFLAYWRTRAEDGVAWIDGLNCFLGNTVMIPFRTLGLGCHPGRGIPPASFPRTRPTLRRYVSRRRCLRHSPDHHAGGLAAQPLWCACQLHLQPGAAYPGPGRDPLVHR